MTSIDSFRNKLICGDTLAVCKTIPSESVDCIATSVPYWGLRNYGVDGQLGLEKTLGEYIDKCLAITSELKRILKPTGVLWWDHGDCYGGTSRGSGPQPKTKQRYNEELVNFSNNPNANMVPKSMCLQNERLLIRLADEQGWIVRNQIIWHKKNHMPSSVKDRLGNAYEPIYMLTKEQRYWFDLDAIRVPVKSSSLERMQYGRNENKYQGTLCAGGGNLLNPRPNVHSLAVNPYQGKFAGMSAEEANEFSSPRARTQRFNYRVRDAAKKAGHCPQFEASEEEIAQYSADTAECHPNGKNPGDVWEIATQPLHEEHFASFPEKLIEPMILSSCPKEICNKCNKPRVRISKYEREYEKSIRDDDKKQTFRNFDGQRWNTKIKESGWTDCGCNAGWSRGIVFDPFMGSGTSAVVAKRLLRDYIGIDINAKYLKIAEKRINNTMAQETFL